MPRSERAGVTQAGAQERYKNIIAANNDAIRKRLIELAAERDAHIEDFNRLRKCLEILLDTGLFDMAIRDSAIVRKVTNDFAHVNYNVDNSSFHEMLGRVQEIFDAAQSDSMQEGQIQDSIDRLAGILYFSEDYFDKQVTNVEESVDQFIRSNAGEPGNYVTDFHILLNRLDSANWVL